MILVRPASQDDASGMARVIVDTWFDTHENQVSAQVLQNRREKWGYAESERGWRRTIEEANGASTHVLVATHEGNVIAVAASEEIEASYAELGSLYVDVAYQRSGIGRRLFEATIEYYRGIGFSALHVAVLATNRPARRFYERLGGRCLDARDHEDGPEVVYAWDIEPQC